MASINDLEKRLWEVADQLRANSSLTAQEYSRPVLENLKTQKLVLDWKKKQQTRAGVRLAISKFLDQLPPVYSKDLYEKKCDVVYQFIYDLELEAPKGARVYSYH